MSKQTDATSVRTIGIDTGKNTLHLIGLDQRGTIVLREKLARGRSGARLANVQRCLIGIEARMATHYVARELLALGHDVRQVPPAYAKPFRQGHKNDFRARISIVAKSANALFTGRIQKRKTSPSATHIWLATHGRSIQLGHQRRFERAVGRSALPLIPDVLLSRSKRRSAAVVALVRLRTAGAIKF